MAAESTVPAAPTASPSLPPLSANLLRVAIIGGGPAGLAAAIELGRRPFVDWTLYEKKPVISEIGNGLSLQQNTWRMLELNGAAVHISADDIFRPTPEHYVQHRNAETARLLLSGASPSDTPSHQLPCRAQRSVLQQALLRETDQSRVRVGHQLVRIAREGSRRLRLTFQDGKVDDVDLLIGADGIRSAVRRFAFPDHTIAYTGSTAYRTVVRATDALRINGIPNAVTFWHGVGGRWIYTCPLGHDQLEITARAPDPELPGVGRVSWGHDVPVAKFLDSFRDVALPLRQLLGLVSSVGQYDFFAGPRLQTLISGPRPESVSETGPGPVDVVLVGDASHPLSGAFGAGAAFALEDAHVLGGALSWAHETAHRRRRPDSSSRYDSVNSPSSDVVVDAALELFDRVRSPHYAALYGVLDEFRKAEEALAARGVLPHDEEIAQRVASVWHRKHTWMYQYEADSVLRAAIVEEKAKAGSGEKAQRARL